MIDTDGADQVLLSLTGHFFMHGVLCVAPLALYQLSLPLRLLIEGGLWVGLGMALSTQELQHSEFCACGK